MLSLNQIAPCAARLVELVDTSDLKFDSFMSTGSSPVASTLAKMVELVDMLGLGSSSYYRSRGSSPLFGI
jgi:hypothetical protein